MRNGPFLKRLLNLFCCLLLGTLPATVPSAFAQDKTGFKKPKYSVKIKYLDDVMVNPNYVAPNIIIGGEMTRRGMVYLFASGFNKFIDLRADDERGALPEEEFTKRAIDYIHIPITPETLNIVQVHAFAKAIEDPTKGPFVVFDTTGERAYGVWAVYLNQYRSVNRDRAIRDAEKFGLKSESLRKFIYQMMDGF